MRDSSLFAWSAIEAASCRVSHRTYDGRPILPEVRAVLEEACRQPPPAPFGSAVRLGLVDTTRGGEVVPLGTYGMIKGAPTYLVGAVRQCPHAEEDFGFVFEWAILRATALGLGTCWLGGTLRREQFAAAMALQEGEKVLAVSPVGYPASRRGVLDAAVRWGAGSKSRKPWSALFFSRSFGVPLAEGEAGPYARVLETVRRAPSASNRQPWRIVRDGAGNAFHLFLQRTAGYPSPGVDLQRIDMGIAMCHFALSAHELGLDGAWRLSPPEVGPLPERTSYVATWVEGPAARGEGEHPEAKP